MDTRPIGASYARISGASDDRTASLETQEEANVSKLEAEGFQCPPEYRYREQFTGYESIYERPVLIGIRGRIATGAIQALCCYDTDRLARDPQQLMGVVGNTEKAGCKALFCKMDHRTGRIGELVLYMRGFASSIEYDAIKDRTTRGRMKVLQGGQLMGNGPTRYGYTFDRETRLRQAHPEHASVIREIFEKIAGGMSSVQLAEELSQRGLATPSAGRKQKYKDHRGARWNHSTIRGIIKDETYLGHSTATRSEVVGKHKSGKPKMKPLPRDRWAQLNDGQTEAIVSEELWRRANEALIGRRNKPIVQRQRDSHLLAGHLYCARCGLKMTTTTKQTRGTNGARGGKGKMFIYRCTAKFPGRKVKVDCPVSSLSARKIDDLAWAKIAEHIATPTVIERWLESLKDGSAEEQIRRDLEAAEIRRKTAERRLSNLAEAISEIDSKLAREAIREKIRSVETEIKESDRAIRDLTSRLVPFARYEETCQQIRSQVARIHAKILNPALLSFDEKRDVLEWLAVRVFAQKDKSPFIQMGFPHTPDDSTSQGATENCDSDATRNSSALDIHRLTMSFGPECAAAMALV